MSRILNRQPQIQIVPTYEGIKDKTFPVVSLVKDMTFALVDLTEAPETLAALKPSEAPEIELDSEWSGSFTGALYYKKHNPIVQENEPTIHTIQARMITQNIEDPGTGSACCTLACYLALDEMRALKPRSKPETTKQEGDEETELVSKTKDVKLEETKSSTNTPKFERHVYAIQQGVEMGRLCTIAVEVDLKTAEDGSKSIVNVTLSGRACFFARGELML